MSSKRDSGDWTAPRRLFSVREKMSGLVQRGRGLAKKTTMSMLREPRHERPSLDEGQKGFPRVQVQDFGTSTLDIDLQSLEAFRIAPDEPQEKKKAPEPQQPPPTTSSTTPIADMFRRRTNLEPPTVISTSSLNKSSPALSAISHNVSKPTIFKVPYEETRTTGPAPSRTTHSSTKNNYSSTPAVSVTIISSSHAQSHTTKPWPPPETPRSVAAPSRFSNSNASDSRQSTRPQVYEPRRAAYVPSGPAPITTPPVARPRINVGAVAEQQQQHTDKRHSTPIATSTHGALTIAVPRLLGGDNSQTDRRRSWQTAPTSVPSSTPRSSGPPSASAPWRESTQRASARIASDRLAWIREIEAKKNKPTINSDLPVLKTMQGSVADKLARFESKRQEQQQMTVPLTRSNSTRSRTSSMADTFSSSMGGGVATTRSSLDSHRTSSVFSHYDDSFRDKMEFITGNAKRKGEDDADDRPALNRVTAAFVSVDKSGKQAPAGKGAAKAGVEGAQNATSTPLQIPAQPAPLISVQSADDTPQTAQPASAEQATPAAVEAAGPAQETVEAAAPQTTQPASAEQATPAAVEAAGPAQETAEAAVEVTSPAQDPVEETADAAVEATPAEHTAEETAGSQESTEAPEKPTNETGPVESEEPAAAPLEKAAETPVEEAEEATGDEAAVAKTTTEEATREAEESPKKEASVDAAECPEASTEEATGCETAPDNVPHVVRSVADKAPTAAA
ncbi:hypothetical protein CPLU01_13975 [Colletotrichum plurivorum]|uniref:Uncharacterized protein n=1 Tax=Colletotrichum plurivorum TaxID=2175906 RepID=A0A8H6N1F9_9PEZI|nr:hypothetical protein CPLU01_13975 [Colletotrichum plurivorum]